jgi:general secretion pathway protein G
MTRPYRIISSGFSMIELVAVLAILSVLALMVLPVAELVVQRQKESELRTALREIRMSLDAHKRAVDTGRVMVPPGASGYPARLTDLVEGVEDARDPYRRPIHFLRRLPRDPFAPADLSAEATWATRAYASPWNDPRPGEDVFDVFSRSERTGLNGIPYREW